MGLKYDTWHKQAADGFLTPVQKEISKRLNSNYPLTKEYMMIEEDMSFMKDAFLNKQLPYPEYLVESGYHPMTKELMERDYKDDNSPLHKMVDKYGLHFAAKYEIPCAGGALFKVSVISGMMFYSRKDAPYEIMGPTENEDDGSGDPLAYQTDEELMLYLAKLIAKAKEY